MTGIDNFIGKWQLIADKSEYQEGTPPKSAIYSFASHDGIQLNVTIEWANDKDEFQKIEYNLIPDGKKRPIPGTENELMSDLSGEKTLNSSVYLAGQLISFASRHIDVNGIMTVLQKNYEPVVFANTQYYKKIDKND